MIPEYENLEDGELLFNLDLIASILSTLGSLLMCYFCYRTPAPRTISIKFIFAIAIADLFYSIANLMSVFERIETLGLLCMVEAVTRQSSFTFSILFSACTAVVSYKASLPHSTFDRTKFFNLSVFVFPLIYIIATVFG